MTRKLKTKRNVAFALIGILPGMGGGISNTTGRRSVTTCSRTIGDRESHPKYAGAAAPHTENQRSQRVLARPGFQKEGLLREFYSRDGLYNDQVQFSLLRREWQQANPE